MVKLDFYTKDYSKQFRPIIDLVKTQKGQIYVRDVEGNGLTLLIDELKYIKT